MSKFKGSSYEEVLYGTSNLILPSRGTRTSRKWLTQVYCNKKPYKISQIITPPQGNQRLIHKPENCDALVIKDTNFLWSFLHPASNVRC